MTITDEPILSRLDRLDNMMRQLEDIRGSNMNRSPKSSCASTPSSGTITSDGHASSLDFSPQSLEKHCRPIKQVMMETEVKGSLIERLDQVENRVLKFEEELEAEKRKVEKMSEKKGQKKGLKQFVKQCVNGKGERKSRTEKIS